MDRVTFSAPAEQQKFIVEEFTKVLIRAGWGGSEANAKFYAAQAYREIDGLASQIEMEQEEDDDFYPEPQDYREFDDEGGF